MPSAGERCEYPFHSFHAPLSAPLTKFSRLHLPLSVQSFGASRVESSSNVTCTHCDRQAFATSDLQSPPHLPVCQ